MRELKRFTEAPRACSYLPDRQATLENRLLLDVSPGELEAMLVRGWRRFGPMYFRPACVACFECVSLRIPVDGFQPSDSQSRALRRIRRFRLEVGPPQTTPDRVALHQAWHALREVKRDWQPSGLTLEEYYYNFGFPHPAGLELALYEGGELVAVSLCDVTPKAFSAVYFFYHPRIARLSPGVANVMLCLEQARARGIPHLYLGYRVIDCPSMKYKATYRPHQLLQGRPGFDEEPKWVDG
jgi:arginine-tRNA-protein transferase